MRRNTTPWVLFLILSLTWSIQAGATDPIPVLSTTDRQYLDGRYSPQPATTDRSVIFYANGIGASQGDAILEYGRWGDSTPLGRLDAAHIIAWGDDRVVIALPPQVNEAGQYWLRYRRGTVSSAVDFNVTLARPQITSYSASTVCPGDSLTIRGTHFTTRRGAWTLLLETWPDSPGSTPHSVTLDDHRTTRWSDRAITFTVPTDLSGYIRAGYHFRLRLLERDTARRAYHPVARGPEARFSDDCRAFFEAANATRYRIRFALGRPVTRVQLGRPILFGGTLSLQDTPAILYARRRPVTVQWAVKKLPGHETLAQGQLRVRSRRTPLLAAAHPGATGRYYLDLKVVGNGRFFVDDWDAVRQSVQVFRASNQQPARVDFQPAPLQRSIRLGEHIVFGGTFRIADRDLLRAVRSHPLPVDWKIVQQGSRQVVASGHTLLRSARTPLLAGATPGRAGRYYLQLDTPPSRHDYRLHSPDLRARTIQVLATVRLQKPLPKQGTPLIGTPHLQPLPRH
ncbi:MAG: hypothetical protein P8009_00585 [Gammaproteobacteria bacterium]